jgi:methane/ammonia monooxygenase subunit C
MQPKSLLPFATRQILEIAMSVSRQAKAIAVAASPQIIDLRPLAVALISLTGFVFLLRFYEQLYAWTDGLDSFSPEFQTHWTSLLNGAFLTSGVSFTWLMAYLWKTRDRDLNAITHTLELQRLGYLIQWLLVLAMALYWGLSFFSEQTAVWHMTAIRDTDFTPSNIVTFYIAYPMFAIIGAGAFLYARTRIPFFSKGYSLAFGVLVVGIFMTIPNVGFNEWGHTAWIMDEGFAGPLHWGFVFFGWMSLAVFGVVLQILMRIHAILGSKAIEAIGKN